MDIYTLREDCSLLGHPIYRSGVAEMNHTYDEIYESNILSFLGSTFYACFKYNQPDLSFHVKHALYVPERT